MVFAVIAFNGYRVLWFSPFSQFSGFLSFRVFVVFAVISVLVVSRFQGFDRFRTPNSRSASNQNIVQRACIVTDST